MKNGTVISSATAGTPVRLIAPVSAAAAEIEQHRAYLMRYASLQLRDAGAAEDAVQDTLMAALEDEFSIEMDIDDIIDFSSFEVGKTLLNKYGVTFA